MLCSAHIWCTFTKKLDIDSFQMALIPHLSHKYFTTVSCRSQVYSEASTTIYVIGSLGLRKALFVMATTRASLQLTRERPYDYYRPVEPDESQAVLG